MPFWTSAQIEHPTEQNGQMVFLSSTGAPAGAERGALCDEARMPFRLKPAIPAVGPRPDARRKGRRDSASGAAGICARLGREREVPSVLRISIVLPPRPGADDQNRANR